MAERLSRLDPSLHAPHVLDVEVAQVVRRLSASGAASAGRGRQALEDLADVDLLRHPHDVVLPVIWRLRDNQLVEVGGGRATVGPSIPETMWWG